MRRRTPLIFTLLMMFFLAACGQAVKTPPLQTPLADSDASPTVEMSQISMPTEVQNTDTPFPTVTPFPTFTPMPAQTEQAAGPTSTPACTDLIEFVKNLTINDNAVLKMGVSFAKLWQVKNAGTCTWNTGYTLVFVTGDQMSAPASNPLTEEVLPGRTADLRLDLISPMMPGVYTGSWMLQDENGNRFGLIPDGSQPLNLTIQIKPAPMPTSG